MPRNRTRFAGGLAGLALVLATVAAGTAQELTLEIPPVKSSVTIGNQPITIAASGAIWELAAQGNQKIFALKLTADLSDLQAHIADLLRAQLDRSDRCGEHISIEDATIAPAEPVFIGDPSELAGMAPTVQNQSSSLP
jgi:hypothetical protein